MVKYTDTQLDRIFHALADTTRRGILQQMAVGNCTVTELATPYNMSLAAVSKHLKVLEGAGLLAREKQGRQYICHLAPGALKTAESWLKFYQQFWNDKLDSLESFLTDEKD